MSFNTYYLKWEVRNKQYLDANVVVDSADKLISKEGVEAPSANTTTTDVMSIDTSSIASSTPIAKPLRADADIYIQIDSALEYSVSLPSFLLQKGFIIAPYKAEYSYKVDDIILLSDTNLKQEGANVYYLSSDKKALWAFLKARLPGLV